MLVIPATGSEGAAEDGTLTVADETGNEASDTRTITFGKGRERNRHGGPHMLLLVGWALTCLN